MKPIDTKVYPTFEAFKETIKNDYQREIDRLSGKAGFLALLGHSTKEIEADIYSLTIQRDQLD